MKRPEHLFAGVLLVLSSPYLQAQHDHSHHHDMQFDRSGMVMNTNDNKLPKDCQKVSRDYAINVYAGRDYAVEFPDKVFGYSDYEVKVEPCSRIEVTFTNEDQVRHQWMVHGLPRYLYGQGMFHLEAAGGQTVKGTFIVPGDHKTYLIHCDIAQHMEKGMKVQLVVGEGSGDLWAVPGIAGDFNQQIYVSNEILLMVLIVFALVAVLFVILR